MVGAGGRLGAALYRALRASGEAAFGTRRRRPLARGELLLDLAEGSAAARAFELPACVDRAFLCAAVTSEVRCRNEREGSRRINVEACVALAERLVARGAFVVFPSTDRVFDGSRPRRRADDPPSPRSAYGEQKAEAERLLLALGAGVAVLRLGKVVDPELPLLRSWRRELRAGRPIAPFSDLRLSPIPLARAAEALRAVARARRGGIFQLSAEGDLSYAEVAHELARRLGAPEGLVQPVRASEAGLDLAPLARHTTLASDRLRDELGLPAPSLREGLEALLRGAKAPERAPRRR